MYVIHKSFLIVQNRRPVPNAQLLVAKFTINRNYSTLYYIDNFKLDPWWITGFIDGEGCFSISISKNNKTKTGWKVQARFKMCLHIGDKPLLKKIMYFFGVVSIIKWKVQSVEYAVQSVKDLQKIIYHFDKYPLLTQKKADYLLFKQIFNLMLKREHLTQEGLRKIVAIKASMNRGLSPELKLAKNPPIGGGVFVKF